MLETAWESRWLPGSLKNLLVDFEGTKQVWQYGSGRCTLKTAHRKFSIKRAMQTANDAGDTLRRNVRKRHQISMIRKSFYITVQRISITDAIASFISIRLSAI